VSGKWQFFLHRKDADSMSTIRLRGWIWWQDESRFRQVHFAGQRVHLFRRQAVPVQKHSERISLQRRRSEDIDLHHLQALRQW
jgi:hypothetical protein